MSADHLLYAVAEAWLRGHRHAIAIKLEEAMTHLSDLIDNGKKLASERSALTANRDAEKARADAAEAHVADLQAKIDADDATAAAAADDLAKEIATEAGVTSSTTTTSSATPAPVVDTSAGTTTHTAADGTTTVLDHTAGTVAATDASGAPVTPVPSAVDAVVMATVDAGVAVPEDVKGTAQAQPVI